MKLVDLRVLFDGWKNTHLLRRPWDMWVGMRQTKVAAPLEFRIPISPKPSFYSQIRLIALSLARLGPPYSEAKIQVSVGDRPAASDVATCNPWAKAFPVEWHIIPHDVYDRAPSPWLVSGMDRYVRPSEADMIVLCDADTCAIARFDNLLGQLACDQPTIAGLQAHYTPFHDLDNDATWRMLLQAIGAPDTPLSRRYSMDVDRAQGWGPPYFNYGFVAFNASAFRVISAVMDKYLHLACNLLNGSPFSAQVALTLALIASKVQTIALGHEYNCVNDDGLLAHHLVALDDIRVIHYLRTNEFNRHDFLCDQEKFNAFIGATKSNAITERLRHHVMSIPAALIDWA